MRVCKHGKMADTFSPLISILNRMKTANDDGGRRLLNCLESMSKAEVTRNNQTLNML
jgi:hypothetical protein